jgi:hypothetical protein
MQSLMCRLGIAVACLLMWGQSAVAQSIVPPGSSAPVPGRMPIIKAETLLDRKLTLPQDLPAERTLVLIAFEQAQQAIVETWVDGMRLKESLLPWIETPVMDPGDTPTQTRIKRGMLQGVSDQALRDRTIALFTDRIAFYEALGLAKPGQTASKLGMHAAVIDRAGRVLALAEGDYSKAKADTLISALGL